MEEAFISYLEVNRGNGILVNCLRVRDTLTWAFGIENIELRFLELGITNLPVQIKCRVCSRLYIPNLNLRGSKNSDLQAKDSGRSGS
jgi:hypothetical protein